MVWCVVILTKRNETVLTRKGGNCDALLLEVRQMSRQSFWALITRP